MHEKIIDSTSQQPIPGATVASGKQTVLTNAEDNFAANTDRGKNLTVSFVGYGTQTVTSLTRALAIQLSAASQQLIDVVVTALGVKKGAKRVGYAVRQANSEDIVKARDQNPLTGLTGKVAGF